MKKTLLTAFCVLSFACLKAQTYTSGHISVVQTFGTSYDSTYCTGYDTVYYAITIDSSFTGEIVNIVDTLSASLIGSFVNTTGASPWTFSTIVSTNTLLDATWYLTGPGYSYISGPTTKITSDVDTLRYVTCYDSFYVANPCSYGMASGFTYIDNNANCIFDTGDVGLDGIGQSLILTETLSSPLGTRGSNITSSGCCPGYYGFIVQQSWMVNYTISVPPYLAFIFPTSPCFSGSYTFTTLPQDSVDIPLLCSSNIDVQCYALSPGSVRLHRAFYMQPYVSNTGCDTASGQLTLIKDSRVIYDSSLSIYPADTVRGDTLIWNYSNLSNLSSGAYWNSFLSDIYLSLDSTVIVGDTLCFSGYTNIPAADIDPTNNSFAFCMPVVYSYDPNEKEVSPKGVGPQGYIPAGNDTLTYALHFQNTGSDVAYNVTIIDTLDSHINASSLRILGTSHNMTPQWLTPHVVQFNFNNIFLPDSSSNEPASHGEVRFSVALNTGLPVGTQIKNTGYIYFDSNPAVITNTVLNTITTPTKVDQVTTAIPVKVYPNPATDHIIVENLNGGELFILNINGEVILNQAITNNKTTIDVSKLPGGVYMIKTINNTNTTTTKLTKY